MRPQAAVKSATAFRTISEVSADLGVPQHVLRFWESRFPQIRPLKRGGGRRYYRPDDVELLRRIQSLLHNDGYTIKGVQRLLKDARAAGGRGSSVLPAAPQASLTVGTAPSQDAPAGPVGTGNVPPCDDPAMPSETATDAAPSCAPSASDELAAPSETAIPDHVRQEIAHVINELKALRALIREPAEESENFSV
ncbi:MerR family transcriptional regulator [Azospirillum sp. SYSU D00513]|uniref:MerR family transcriptional regulator n=1 Tax=Azospirillum sp. SYSU D00513 TaxID=2812561 RepID=UPI001A957BD9|nr:MerR family transcriptional regulator [Azospirillum sp. SYSU D00513]